MRPNSLALIAVAVTILGSKGMAQHAPAASVVTSKPAMRGHFKTGHVTWPGT
jgi:hypothetical protein